METPAFIDVIGEDTLEDGAMTRVEVDGHKLLIARVDGDFFAADAHCPHLHADLSKGTLEGTTLTCPLHHSQFDLRTGEALRWTDWKGAAKNMAEFVRHPRPLRVYETQVEMGIVKVGHQKPPAG